MPSTWMSCISGWGNLYLLFPLVFAVWVAWGDVRTRRIPNYTGALPQVIRADASHAKHEYIVRCASRGVEALPPIPSRSRDPGRNADQRCAVTAWHERMQTERAKQLLRARSSLCELENAHLKHHHGVVQVLVRGLKKVTCVAMLAAIGANILQHATALLV